MALILYKNNIQHLSKATERINEIKALILYKNNIQQKNVGGVEND